MNAPDLTRQGITAYQQGDRAAAAALFEQATQADPQYEMAWLWRSSTAATDGEKRSYLERALEINPSSEPARRGLAKLGAVVEAPPELAEPVEVPATSAPTPASREALQLLIANYTRKGWQIVSQTETTAQLKKPKEWTRAGAVIFVAVPIVLGLVFYWPLVYLAIFGLLLVLVDYMVKKEELRFITAEEAAQSVDIERARKERPFVERLSNGGTVCSSCRMYVRPDAATCKHCKTVLNPPPVGM